MTFSTPDLCDQFAESRRMQIAEPIFKSFGGMRKFSGRIATLKVFEDCLLLQSMLEEKVEHCVLVVDGGGSHRCALMGAELAQMACENGWSGIIVYGCIRDSTEIAKLPIGVLALHTHPLRSHTRGGGGRDSLITFASVNFKTGHFLYADEDGLLIAEERLA